MIKIALSKIMPGLAFIALIALPYTYIYNSTMATVLSKSLPVEVKPSYSGGKVVAVFRDPLADDHGAGNLSYPKHPSYAGRGYLDIVKYTVFEPVTNDTWSRERDYWQLSLTMAAVEGEATKKSLTTTCFAFGERHCHPVVHIYIDIDGTKSGSVDSHLPRTEMVEFSKNNPWDFMVHIDGYAKEGTIVSADHEYQRIVQYFYFEKKKRLVVRIALDDPRLKSVLDGRPTYHYVMVGAYDRMAKGKFGHVQTKATMRHGGGALSDLTPRVYDVLSESSTGQQKMLLSYDEEKYRYSLLVPAKAERGRVSHAEKASRLLAEYKKRLKVETPVPTTLESISPGLGEMEKAILFFERGEFGKAEALIDKVLKENPQHTIAQIHKASLISIKAAKAESLLEKTEIVQKALSLFEQIKPSTKKENELLTLYLHRGNVYLAIPERPFGKSAAAAEDFSKAAEILKKSKNSDPQHITDCYLKAAYAYQRIKKIEMAEQYYMKASNLDGLSNRQIIRLLEKGFIPKQIDSE